MTSRNVLIKRVSAYPDYVREQNGNLEHQILLNEQRLNRFLQEERLRQSIAKHVHRKESF